MNKITGCITALVTPFQENGKIDVPALKKMVNFQIESGIDGKKYWDCTGYDNGALLWNAVDIKK